MLLGLRELRFSSWPSEGRGLFFYAKKVNCFVFAGVRTHAGAHAGHMVTHALVTRRKPVTH
jgi:hypothetical protein